MLDEPDANFPTLRFRTRSQQPVATESQIYSERELNVLGSLWRDLDDSDT